MESYASARQKIWFSLSSQGAPDERTITSNIQRHRRKIYIEKHPESSRTSRVRGEFLLKYAGLAHHLTQVGDKVMWAAEHNDTETIKRWVLPRCTGKVMVRTRLALLGNLLITAVLFAAVCTMDDSKDTVTPVWLFSVVVLFAVCSLISACMLCLTNIAPWLGECEPGISCNFYINGEFTSLLHVAAAFGSEDVIKCLLSLGADPNVRDLRLRSPLHYAALHGHRKICVHLIQHNACSEVPDDNDMYPYDLAKGSNYCSPTIQAEISSILNAPATVLLSHIKTCLERFEEMEHPSLLLNTISSIITDTKDNRCASVRDMTMSMKDVIGGCSSDESSSDEEDNEVQKSQKTLEKRRRQVKLGTWGMTPLMLICRGTTGSSYLLQWETIVKDMITERNADVDQLHPTKGTTALHEAVRSGNRYMCAVLMSMGADPMRIDYTQGRTVLHDACGNKGNEKIVQRMLENICTRFKENEEEESTMNVNVDCFDIDGTTPFHEAIASGSVAMVKLMLEHGCCNAMLPGKSGNNPILGSMYTPLGWLASKKKNIAVHLEMMKQITATTFSSSVNKRDPSGLTPLHLAARNGNNVIVEWLLTEYKTTIDSAVKCSTSFKTPKEYALANFHPKTVELLEKHERFTLALENSKSSNGKNSDGIRKRI